MGIFSVWDKSVRKTRQNLCLELDGLSGRVTPETLQELEEILLLADVGVGTASRISSMLGERIRRETVDSGELRRHLAEIVTELLGPDAPLRTEPRPAVILVVGVNGVGKTTTAGKLAFLLKKEGKNVILAAADTFRAAAAEQLAVWAGRTGCRIVRHAEGADPAAVVFDALSAAKARNADVVICDTAGRLHTKKNLMSELAKIGRVIRREAADAAVETLLVIDATTGQNGLVQAEEFAGACGVTGIVLTKLDGTARGGIVIGIRHLLGIPVKYVGTGESAEDLTPFRAEDFARALLLERGEN